MTYEQFEEWFGSDHIDNAQDLVALVLELANGKYPLEQFKQDVEG